MKFSQQNINTFQWSFSRKFFRLNWSSDKWELIRFSQEKKKLRRKILSFSHENFYVFLTKNFFLKNLSHAIEIFLEKMRKIRFSEHLRCGKWVWTWKLKHCLMHGEIFIHGNFSFFIHLCFCRKFDMTNDCSWCRKHVSLVMEIRL